MMKQNPPSGEVLKTPKLVDLRDLLPELRLDDIGSMGDTYKNISIDFEGLLFLNLYLDQPSTSMTVPFCGANPKMWEYYLNEIIEYNDESGMRLQHLPLYQIYFDSNPLSSSNLKEYRSFFSRRHGNSDFWNKFKLSLINNSSPIYFKKLWSETGITLFNDGLYKVSYPIIGYENNHILYHTTPYSIRDINIPQIVLIGSELEVPQEVEKSLKEKLFFTN